MTWSYGLCRTGSENWVRERKFLLPLCSSFRGLTKLCLLSLLRWAGCHQLKTSWWEGDGKCPGTGKAPLLIWRCWVVHDVILKSHVTHHPPSSHHSSVEPKAYRPFFRGGSARTDSPWIASCTYGFPSARRTLYHNWQPGHLGFASFSTWRCSSPALRTAWSPWKCGASQ